jgi:DNA primase
MNYSLFDIQSYLEEQGVEFHTSGKNVTAGWIELNCPFCSDPSFHLGVSEQGFYHCWRCGAKGSIVKLVMEIRKVPYAKALDELTRFYMSDLQELRVDIQQRHHHNILPKEATKEFPQIHLDYLTSRNFPHSLINQYDLRACFLTGIYKYRIICPIIEGGYVVNFTALAVSGQEPKYLHCSNKYAVIPMKECVYNIDTVKETAVVMEGVTDVWRFGESGVAMMGIEFTSEQINVLAKKGIKRCFVMFDAEALAQRKAERLAKQLSSFIDEVEILSLPGGDPGDLSEKEVMNIRYQIGL